MPTRQAFVSELVPTSHVQNAVGLNSATFNGGRVFGPAIAGLLIVLVGTGWCFAINAGSFVAVIIGLSLMRNSEMHARPRAPRARGQIREGVRYAWSSPVLRSTLVLVLIVGLFTLNFQVFLPLMAKEVFHGEAGLVGVFSAMQGAGALVASLLRRGGARFTPGFLAVCTTACGALALGMAVAPWLWLELVLVAASGAGFIAMMLTANATLQLNSEPAHARSRDGAVRDDVRRHHTLRGADARLHLRPPRGPLGHGGGRRRRAARGRAPAGGAAVGRASVGRRGASPNVARWTDAPARQLRRHDPRLGDRRVRRPLVDGLRRRRARRAAGAVRHRRAALAVHPCFAVAPEWELIVRSSERAR